MKKKMACRETRMAQTKLILPVEANQQGNLYGGQLLYNTDNVASLSAMIFAGCEVMTAAANSFDFVRPFPQGSCISLESYVSGAGSRSIEVFVKALGQDIETGKTFIGATGFMTMVALPEDPEHFVLPELVPESEEEKYVAAGYEERRKISLAHVAEQKALKPILSSVPASHNPQVD